MLIENLLTVINNKCFIKNKMFKLLIIYQLLIKIILMKRKKLRNNLKKNL